MKQLRIDANKVKIKQRQSELLEYLAKGTTDQRELASLLNTSPATINRDIRRIAKEASLNWHDWIDKKLPLGLKCLLASNDMITKKAWKLLEKNEHRDELEERKFQLEILQFLAALNSLKRNYMVDYDRVMFELTSHKFPRSAIEQ